MSTLFILYNKYGMADANVGQILIVVATAALAFITILFVVISIILNYHWTNYGTRTLSIKRIKRIYIGVSVVLFSIMVTSYVILL